MLNEWTSAPALLAKLRPTQQKVGSTDKYQSALQTYRSQQNRYRNWLFTNFYNNLRIIFMSAEFNKEKIGLPICFSSTQSDCIFLSTGSRQTISLSPPSPILSLCYSAILYSPYWAVNPPPHLTHPLAHYTLLTTSFFLRYLPQVTTLTWWSSPLTGCSSSRWPFRAEGLGLRPQTSFSSWLTSSSLMALMELFSLFPECSLLMYVIQLNSVYWSCSYKLVKPVY